MPGGRNFRESVRHARCTAGLTVAIGGFAAALGAASGAVALAAHSSVPARSASPTALDALPFPGTPDAAPGTNIYLPAASPAQVESVTGWARAAACTPVTSAPSPPATAPASPPTSRSPPANASPSPPRSDRPRAGTASGARGAKQISYSFSIARPVSDMSRSDPGVSTDRAARPAPGRRAVHSRRLTPS